MTKEFFIFLNRIYNKENERINKYALFMIYTIENPNCADWYIKNFLFKY